jgi:molybdate/tungstate transport system ATP-binding protein
VIAVEGLSVRAGAFRLDGVAFEVPAGGYAALMGRTGSGKTTLLETICGLRRAQGGRVRIGAREATALAPAERGIGYVPQDRALFRTMSVRDNLAFGPVVRKWPQAKTEARVKALAEQLGIAGLLDRAVGALSGGEAQRVALGRALAAEPSVLLLDEPLAALDDETREGMIAVLRSLRGTVTALHVTHSRAEAEKLADRVFTLSEGRIS